MKMTTSNVLINNQFFPLRWGGNLKSEFIFLTHHGLVSTKQSFKPMEKWGSDRFFFISFDARGNGENVLKTSRFSRQYTNDLKNIIFWIKKEYPNKKIILMGSSWGAAVIAQLLKKESDLVYRSIIWSVPFKASDSTEIENVSVNTLPKKAVTSKWGFAWRFLVLILFNYKTYGYLQIDLGRGSSNEILQKISKLNQTQKVAINYLWSSYKTIKVAKHNLKKLDKHSKIPIVYLQSVHDGFATKRALRDLQKHLNHKVELFFLNEPGHALQWEVIDNLNIKIFTAIELWITTENNFKPNGLNIRRNL